MKKSAIYILVLLAAVSCKVSEGGFSNHTADALRGYTGGVKFSMVDCTMDVFDKMLEVDAYINASDEEKNDVRFADIRENLRHLDADNLEYAGTNWTIATGGTSLSEPGGAWTLTDSGYSYIYYSWRQYPGHNGVYSVTCTGGNSWELTEGVDEALSMSISGTPSAEVEGKMDFVLLCRGFVDTDEAGYRAEFSGDEMTMTVHVDEDTDGEVYYYYECQGNFFLQTFRGTEAIDWCRIKYVGHDFTYETNL